MEHAYFSDCFIFWAEIIEVSREKWSVYARGKKKETQDSFEPNKSDRKNSIYVTKRRNEIREKLHARFQNPKANFI